MNIRFALLALGLISIVGLSAFSPEAGNKYQAERWEHLGSRKVNFGLDHDVIAVTAFEGAFTRLKLKVTGGSLNMHRMVVEYGNGTKDEIELRHNFMRGSESRIIDLVGNKRVIKTITFWYDTKNAASRRATLHVFGRH